MQVDTSSTAGVRDINSTNDTASPRLPRVEAAASFKSPPRRNTMLTKVGLGPSPFHFGDGTCYRCVSRREPACDTAGSSSLRSYSQNCRWRWMRTDFRLRWRVGAISSSEKIDGAKNFKDLKRIRAFQSIRK